MDWLEGVLSEHDDQANEDENAHQERKGTFRRADIYKMHTYRDALPSVRSAWVLYPGSQLRFYMKDGGPVVERVKDLPEAVEGVGAVPLPPSGVGEGLEGVVEQLLMR
jgi:predicted component of viral defense system (DUF524 family)